MRLTRYAPDVSAVLCRERVVSPGRVLSMSFSTTRSLHLFVIVARFIRHSLFAERIHPAFCDRIEIGYRHP